jgi:hypothetical protein
MGFDLIGIEPNNEDGRYYANSVWCWHPLADYVLDTCDGVWEEYEHWHTNSGHEVSEETAMCIAEHLQELIDSGDVRRDVEKQEKSLESMPDEKCTFCKGKGYRDDALIIGQCNACKGTGLMRPIRTCYQFSEDDVKEFMVFCRNSGGFHIC